MAVNISHGLITGMLFLMVGMVYDRTHTRQIAELSGLAGQMPVIAGLLAFASFASHGPPGPLGVRRRVPVAPGRVAVRHCPSGWCSSSALGVLLGAAYMLWMLQRVVMGSPSARRSPTARTRSPREIFVVAPLVVLIVVIGCTGPAAAVRRSRLHAPSRSAGGLA